MRYFLGVFVPLIFQLLILFIIVEMNAGNGSWVGLGAFLIGIFAIPGTAIINFIYIRSNKEKAGINVITNCLLIALVTPVLTPFLLLAL